MASEIPEKLEARAPSVASAEKGHTLDATGSDNEIELLGYKPELQKNRSMLTLLFQSLAIAAIPYGEGGPLISAIYGGGQLSIFLGWISKFFCSPERECLVADNCFSRTDPGRMRCAVIGRTGLEVRHEPRRPKTKSVEIERVKTDVEQLDIQHLPGLTIGHFKSHQNHRKSCSHLSQDGFGSLEM
jgi:hypothetical protein